MKKILFLIIFSLTLFFNSNLLWAEVIHLQGGGEVVGKIVEETKELIKVKIKGGIVTFLKEQIESVEQKDIDEESYLSDKELYKKKQSEISQNDPQAHLDLGDFAFERNLLDEAEAEYKQAEELDSSYKELVEYRLNEIYEKKANRDYKLALVFYENNNFTRARQILENIFDDYPHTSVAIKAQELLKEIQKELYEKKPEERQIAEDVIVVPVDFKTLNQAIENAASGTTIFVQAGTYSEDEIILKSFLTIKGEGPGVTTLIVGNAGIKSNPRELLVDVTIKDIKIDLKGAPIFLKNAKKINFEKCIITGTNRAFYISESTEISITNCTIADMLEGIYADFSPIELVLRNSILSNNKRYGIFVGNRTKKRRVIPTNPYTGSSLSLPPKETKEDSQEEKMTDIKLYYNNIWGNFYNYYGIEPGKNDISKDPQFVGDGNFHLKPTSPCIDAGDPDPKYNDPDGSRADIGALPYLK